MPEHQLRELIREVVAEILAAQRGLAGPAPAERTNGLVLFTGAALGFESALQSLARLNGRLALDWTQSPSAERILDQQRIAAIGMTPVSNSLVVGHDILIIPTLTVNLVAKVTHGIGDCLASNVISDFIMRGKPVVVATNGACPDSPDKRSWYPHIPEQYAAMLRSNLATLQSFGVRLSDADRLDAAVVKVLEPSASQPAAGEAVPTDAVVHPDRVITAETVHAMAPGSTVTLMPNAIITDLARDAARQGRITLSRRS